MVRCVLASWQTTRCYPGLSTWIYIKSYQHAGSVMQNPHICIWHTIPEYYQAEVGVCCQFLAYITVPNQLSQLNQEKVFIFTRWNETLTVCLLFAQFSYVNLIWNHKSISYSYLILNKCMGIIKMVKICQKVKISKKWPIFFGFDHFITNFGSFPKKLVTDMKR